MTKSEFIETLQESLSNEIPSDKIYENIRYYNQYIAQTLQSGKTEEEVINELGEPRLIARTIIDTYKLSIGTMGRNSSTGEFHHSENTTEEYINEEEDVENYNSNQWNAHYHTRKQRPWYKRVLGVIIALLFIWILIRVGGFALNIFFTIGIPIIFIILLINVIKSIFK